MLPLKRVLNSLISRNFSGLNFYQRCQTQTIKSLDVRYIPGMVSHNEQSDSSTAEGALPESEISRRGTLKAVGAAGIGTEFGLSGLSASTDLATASPENSYYNPVGHPVIADPTAVRDSDGTYWVFATGDNTPITGSCESKTLQIYASDDLVDWDYEGEVFDTYPNWHPEGSNIYLWAPGVYEFDGTYYMYYSAVGRTYFEQKLGVATADHPSGPWTDHGSLTDSSGTNPNTIDAEMYVDDGQPYLLYGSFDRIRIAELSEDGKTWKSDTEVALTGEAYEGAIITERDGYYHLFVSSGSCCEGYSSTYQVEVGRSSSLTGTYVNQDGVKLLDIDEQGQDDIPVLDDNARFEGPGHNTLVTDDAGDDWIVYHGFDRKLSPENCGNFNFDQGRRLFIDRIEWVNGWPEVNDGTPSQVAAKPQIDKALDSGDLPDGFWPTESCAATQSYDGGKFTIRAAGIDMWESWCCTDDEYGAIYQEDGLGSEGTVTVKVTEHENTATYAKAGIMVRNAIPGAGHALGYVCVCGTPSSGYYVLWDTNDNAVLDTSPQSGSTSFPYYLKLEKAGTTFTGYHSSDGANWTEIDSRSVGSANATQDAGMFVSAQTKAELCEATFEEFDIQ